MTAARLGDFYTIYKDDTTEKVKLFARHQIKTSCTKDCRDFRFNAYATKLTGGLAKTWTYLKYISWFAGVWSAVALCWIVLVVFMKRSAT